MWLHRITAVAIIAAFSTLLRFSIVPKVDRSFPIEGDFSIKMADIAPQVSELRLYISLGLSRFQG